MAPPDPGDPGNPFQSLLGDLMNMLGSNGPDQSSDPSARPTRRSPPRSSSNGVRSTGPPKSRTSAFIDAPLKTYSSGMRARLGFAIATAVDPDILLLDEVLQTGDEVFREKSRQRIISILNAAKAVVLVTHDMTWVTEFCTRAILIEDGRVTLDGSAAHAQSTRG